MLGFAGELGQTEVGHFHHALPRQQDVFRLDVPVHDAGFGSRRQRQGDLADDVHGNRGFGGTLAVEELPEIDALDVFLGDVVQSVLFADTEHLDDVVVVEPGCGGGFAGEPFEVGVVGQQIGAEHLQGDLAVQRDLFGQVDVGHAAATEDPQQVKISQRRSAQVGRIHRGVGRWLGADVARWRMD